MQLKKKSIFSRSPKFGRGNKRYYELDATRKFDTNIIVTMEKALNATPHYVTCDVSQSDDTFTQPDVCPDWATFLTLKLDRENRLIPFSKACILERSIAGENSIVLYLSTPDSLPTIQPSVGLLLLKELMGRSVLEGYLELTYNTFTQESDDDKGIISPIKSIRFGKESTVEFLGVSYHQVGGGNAYINFCFRCERSAVVAVHHSENNNGK